MEAVEHIGKRRAKEVPVEIVHPLGEPLAPHRAPPSIDNFPLPLLAEVNGVDAVPELVGRGHVPSLMIGGPLQMRPFCPLVHHAGASSVTPACPCCQSRTARKQPRLRAPHHIAGTNPAIWP